MMTLTVTQKTREADDVFSFQLAASNGQPLPAYEAGAHIDLHLPQGQVRQYSLCMPSGAGQPGSYTVAVLRDPASRGGSIALHDQIRVGMTLMASPPRNLFALVPHAQKTLLFAGGIGITPILCMAQELAARQQDFELHYCCRSRSKAAFADFLESSAFAGRAHLHFDDVSPLDVQACLKPPQAGQHLYVCGPNGFMQHVLTSASLCGWPETQLHREHFAAVPASRPQADIAFEVEIASTGAVHLIPPERSVFEVLDEAGISLPVSCEQGVCGTCVTKLIAGTPDHRDQYLTAAEHARNDCFTPCCSRALSPRLVLDI
ncbi:PDR/VanB family oxidoreductase [Kerstersia sp.]|uniref:PDR/VanB family oxidoreductase n=1 Tax=Kerstersia sp. TaxID=1930783 RepID=UPI003F8DEE67